MPKDIIKKERKKDNTFQPPTKWKKIHKKNKYSLKIHPLKNTKSSLEEKTPEIIQILKIKIIFGILPIGRLQPHDHLSNLCFK